MSAGTGTPQSPSLFEIACLVALAQPVEWMRYCEDCDKETLFFADRDCPLGLVGHCTACGSERIAPFTRTPSEGGVKP